MKHRTVCTLILLHCIFAQSIAQISKGGKPYTFAHKLSDQIEIKKMPPVDVDGLLLEDQCHSDNQPFRFGYGFDVSFNLQNSGTWKTIEGSKKIWRLQIQSQGAYSINLLYDKFWLPEGAEFFVYSKDKQMVIGAFTSFNNKVHGQFATGLVKGDEIILVY